MATGVTADLVAGPLPGTVRIRDQKDYQTLQVGSGDRVAYERALAGLVAGQDDWRFPIFCQACGEVSVAAGTWQHSDGELPNYRERLICPGCGLNNRQRFMATLISASLAAGPTDSPLYLYEQVTAMFAWTAAHVDREVIGSEYLGHGITGGTVIDRIRHEDALALSFDDSGIAAIVSTDVYEHVPDIDAALREAARVIVPGGSLLFSVPFHADRYPIVQRAEFDGARVRHLLPAQYHGNPISDQGSLVFYDHGWELLDRCRAAGFDDAYGIAYWSPYRGYLGGGLQMTFVAERGADRDSPG